jgi:hypothetical protein
VYGCGGGGVLGGKVVGSKNLGTLGPDERQIEVHHLRCVDNQVLSLCIPKQAVSHGLHCNTMVGCEIQVTCMCVTETGGASDSTLRPPCNAIHINDVQCENQG